MEDSSPSQNVSQVVSDSTQSLTLPPRLIVIVGPSGVGKGTLCRRLVQVGANLALSISMTSRDQRPGEVHGKDYFFATPEEFKAKIAENGFLEWAEYNGKYYGTPRDFVEEQLNQGKAVLLEIDAQGAHQVKAREPNALTVFIEPPSLEELQKRLEGRGTNTPEDIERRMAIARDEMAQKDQFEHQVVNDSLEQCFQDLVAVLSQSSHP